MADYRLSGKAASDLDGIYEYTIVNFGLDQARNYMNGFHQRFDALAENPDLGRNAANVAPDLRRIEVGSHIVFYVPRDADVLIVRVLHVIMSKGSDSIDFICLTLQLRDVLESKESDPFDFVIL